MPPTDACRPRRRALPEPRVLDRSTATGTRRNLRRREHPHDRQQESATVTRTSAAVVTRRSLARSPGRLTRSRAGRPSATAPSSSRPTHHRGTSYQLGCVPPGLRRLPCHPRRRHAPHTTAGKRATQFANAAMQIGANAACRLRLEQHGHGQHYPVIIGSSPHVGTRRDKIVTRVLYTQPTNDARFPVHEACRQNGCSASTHAAPASPRAGFARARRQRPRMSRRRSIACASNATLCHRGVSAAQCHRTSSATARAERHVRHPDHPASSARRHAP